MIASKSSQFLIPYLFILLSKSLIETVLSNEQNSSKKIIKNNL